MLGIVRYVAVPGGAQNVQVALMKTPGVVMLDAFDLGKHTFAEAFERERMQAPQYLPVGFLANPSTARQASLTTHHCSSLQERAARQRSRSMTLDEWHNGHFAREICQSLARGGTWSPCWAGADLCLHLIRKDHCAAVAAESARLAVAPLERAGGQPQFIRQVAPVAHGSLQSLQEWITRNLANRFSVVTLARRHATSVRTLHRRFVEQTGLTPAQWIYRRLYRPDRAQRPAR